MILKDIWLDVKAVQERDPREVHWRYCFYIREFMHSSGTGLPIGFISITCFSLPDGFLRWPAFLH